MSQISLNIYIYIYVILRSATFLLRHSFCSIHNMSLLTKKEIIHQMKKGSIIINPFIEDNLGSNSYDLTIGPIVSVYTNEVLQFGNKNANHIDIINITDHGSIELNPDRVYLFSTNEYVETKDCVGTIHARSSAARLGIDVICSGGIGDIGYGGFWTMAVSVRQRVIIPAMAKIAQMLFHSVRGKITTKYTDKPTAKYQNKENMPISSREQIY